METVVSNTGAYQAGSIAIPAGYYLREVVQIEKAGAKVLGGIKYGSDIGLDDIIGSFNMDANGQDRVLIDRYRTPDLVYFDAVEDWNGAQVDIHLVLGSLGG